MDMHGADVEVVIGDITQERVDAIVNAANAQLAGGGGVDGAIHRAGGWAIMEECRKLRGCPTGDAKSTTAGQLAAKWVIHAVGPRYRDGKQGERDFLASAYRRSMEVAKELGAKSVSFPAISCGVYGYPLEDGAEVAVNTILDFLKENSGIERVRFVMFSRDTWKVFQGALDRAAG
jgi:O-acetyl-ADP-ribose deacetylase (regulator of RNase III)